MRGETRRKARRRYPGDEALRRVSPRRRRERRRRERERGRATEHRAELDQRCQARSRSGPTPSEPKQGVASCAGLAPEAVYVYGERGEGRANRPPCTGSTVAPTVTAHGKANQHSTDKYSEPYAIASVTSREGRRPSSCSPCCLRLARPSQSRSGRRQTR